MFECIGTIINSNHLQLVHIRRTKRSIHVHVYNLTCVYNVACNYSWLEKKKIFLSLSFPRHYRANCSRSSNIPIIAPPVMFDRMGYRYSISYARQPVLLIVHRGLVIPSPLLLPHKYSHFCLSSGDQTRNVRLITRASFTITKQNHYLYYE